LKEYPEFRGRDLRAVENPYEAAFELADMAGDFSRRTVLWLWALVFFFSIYMALTCLVIYFNLYVFNQSVLRYLGLAMAAVNLVVGALSLWWISTSMRSLGSIGRNHGLLVKIDETAAGEYPKSTNAGAIKSTPQNALNSLIRTTMTESRQLLAKFRLVYSFITLWMVNALLYYTIQSFRFGFNIVQWKLDWIVPGGFGVDAFIFLVVSIIAYLRTRDRFVFLSTRYDAIDYALNRPRAKVPAGADSLERFKAFLASKNDYRDGSGWKKEAYFDGIFQTPSGKMLVKSLQRTPDDEALAEFVRHARAQGPNVRHAVMLYPEEAARPLPESVYNEVVRNPVRFEKGRCTVELVMEGQDGFYDLIPVVSP
jgi:hypothetical protein